MEQQTDHIPDIGNKVTAVAWLIEQVYSDEYQKAFGQTYISIYLIEQAKAMEKEQIIKAHGVKLFQGRKDGWDSFMEKSGEQYYNETYNK